MAAHRYWRYFHVRAGGATTVVIGELQLRTAIGGASVATGGTASSSSNQVNWEPAKAFNGDAGGTNNCWAAATQAQPNIEGYGQWLQYDFGAGNEKDIIEIAISNGTYSTYNALPLAFNIEYSDDGVNWTLARRIWETTAWSATGTVRVYPVTPLGPADITNRRLGQLLRRAPGRPDTKIEYMSMIEHTMDTVFGGTYKIVGNTTSLGNPAARRVRLYHQVSGLYARQMHTGPDGHFEFTNIEKGPWMVVGVDDTGVQNGTLFTHVEAVPM